VYLNAVPEFAALIPATHLRAPGSLVDLRPLFSALMTAEPQSFIPQLRNLVARYREGGASPAELDVAPLVLDLYSQFPDDIGVFCPYMLNHVKLQPGESIFLGAGEPHAYISGGKSLFTFAVVSVFSATVWITDIMECMANSDNVLRAGLTPKPRDVPNLLASLSYISGDPVRHAIQPVPFYAEGITGRLASTVLYKPPTPEFSVLRTVVTPGCVETHRAIRGPSIVVVLGGQGIIRWAETEKLEVTLGHVLFVGQGAAVQFEAGVAKDEQELVIYRAFVEVGM